MTLVTVNPELCTSNQECLRVAPNAFALNAEGISTPTHASREAPIELLLRAARYCPVQAISVFDDNGEALYVGPET
jgi:ferredoxin